MEGLGHSENVKQVTMKSDDGGDADVHDQDNERHSYDPSCNTSFPVCHQLTIKSFKVDFVRTDNRI